MHLPVTRIIVLLVLILTFIPPVVAEATQASSWQQKQEQTLRGRVVDRASKAPLVGVNVIVLGTEPLLGTTTDSDGQFVLHDVPLGRRDIQVSYLGY